MLSQSFLFIKLVFNETPELTTTYPHAHTHIDTHTELNKSVMIKILKGGDTD